MRNVIGLGRWQDREGREGWRGKKKKKKPKQSDDIYFEDDGVQDNACCFGMCFEDRISKIGTLSTRYLGSSTIV